MQLKVLIINNFRQFCGKNIIKFSSDTSKNVTVIHGANGSGKTTILNAFSWVLYGKVYFENFEKIFSEKLFDEIKKNDKFFVEVSLQFEDDNKIYDVKRSKVFNKISNEKWTDLDENVYMSYIDDTGRTIPINNPGVAINRILPERLHPYFFFDGEKIDNLASLDSIDKIKDGIKNIMGIELIERCITHLKGAVLKTLKNDLEEFSDDETKDILRKENELQDELDDLNNRLIEYHKNKEALKNEKELIFHKLRKLENSKELQERREQLNDESDNIQAKIKQVRETIREEITKNGFTVFTKDFIQKGKDILENKRKKKEVPSPIKPLFVQDLIEDGSCICGRKIEKDSQEHLALLNWLKSLPSQDLEDAVTNTNSGIEVLEQVSELTSSTLKKFNAQLIDYKNDLKIIREQRDEIRKKLSEKDSEDIQALEKRIESIEFEISDLDGTIGVTKEKIKNIEEKLRVVKKQRSSLKQKERMAKIAQKRVSSAEKVCNTFEQFLLIASDMTRKDVSHSIHNIFTKIIRKDYWPELSEDYELKIMHKVGDQVVPVGKGTGERQITSLCFISGLVNIAKTRYEQSNEQSNEHSWFQGGIYPIVMDSPFGILDNEYQQKITELIPNLAPQIIIMASNSQWSDVIEKELRPRIGKEYLLQFNKPEIAKKNNNNYKTFINGIEHQALLIGGKYEYTTIKEI